MGSYYPRGNETIERLINIGFTFEEANNLMDWWADDLKWLMTTSEETIRASTPQDAFGYESEYDTEDE